MNEEINLAEDTNPADELDELFAEDADGQDTNAPAEPENRQENEGEPAPAEEEPKYKVNFLGEEMELPVSELVTAAQKGMNYDHVKSELDRLRASAEQNGAARAMMEQMARSSGMTVEEYTELCKNTLEESKLREQLDRGIPEDAAKRLLELEEKERLRGEEEERQREEAQKREAYSELIREYPDLTSLPDEVAAAVAEGESPLNAYRAYELRQLKTELAALKKTAENRRKSTGSLQGDAPEETDDFLMGFDSI